MTNGNASAKQVWSLSAMDMDDDDVVRCKILYIHIFLNNTYKF